ncbi:STAS domain-containing protein [Bacillus atrophaeus]|uniref:STAS domain-containing protein n=1 Tax=Bacillus atrophaeus TaxID=1452 RepID=UPI0022822FD1|nr:STAS domain-containing protein [Bacillus atrophaeus]MCY8977064.1 STAS domain-containing protein [Bacillus atrophaeus]
MEKINVALYQYLTEHANEMTYQWLQKRAPKDTLHYAADRESETELKEREQHEALISIVAKALTGKEKAGEELNKWALQFARDRAVHEVPVFESVGQFKIFRGIVWSRVQAFSETCSQEVAKQDVFGWSERLNHTIDEIIEVFTEEYHQVTIIQLNAQKEMINELSAPIMPISDGIGILPLVGEIDTYRARTILESVLEQCSALRLSYLFLDISGVPIVDTMVAYQIFKVIDSTKLLGIETIISGIRPEIAQTVVKLGIDFSNVKTERSLVKALSKRGFKIHES